MSEVQIAIIDQENTQIALAVPGVQGPAGAISSGGSANQVFYKVSGTNYDAGWTFIGNANVDAAAAIAGTKISPNFGSQTVATTGVFSHALGSQGAPTITFTGDTNTGIYSPGADQVAISTNGTQKLSITSNGSINYLSGTLNYTGTSVPNGSNNQALFVPDYAIGLGGQFGSINFPTTSSAPTTTAWWMLGRAHGLDNTFSLQIRRGGSQSDHKAYVVETSSADNTKIIDNHQWYTNSNERLRITSAGLVGIGTSSPSSALDVSGAISLGAVALPSAGTARIFSRNTDSNLYIQTGSGNTLNFLDGSQNTMASFGSSTVTLQTGNSPRLSIDSSGRVGIGTTSPNDLVEIKTDGGTGNALRLFSPSTTNPSTLLFTNNYSSAAIRCIPVAATTSADLGFNVAGSERARIDSSGRLLVGTSTSTNNVRVQENFGLVTTGSGNIGGMAITNYGGTGASARPLLDFNRSRGTTDGSFTVVASGDQLGSIIFRGADGSQFVDAAFINCEVDGTPGANDMPGRLVFSTTPDGLASPTPRMRIANNGVFTHFSDGVYNFRTGQAASGSAAGIDLTHSSTTLDNGTLSFRVFTNGNTVNTNNSYLGISDIKLKENIVDANSQWADLKALQVRNYNLKEETGQQTHTQIGLVAQEVELISPGLVSESPDRDGEGNDLGTVTKSVNYSVLYMKAVKALQEAMERIETLEQRLTAAGID